MFFEKLIAQSSRALPMMVDEMTALECITIFSGVAVTSLEECTSGSLPGVFLCERETEKKHLSIRDIRNCIDIVARKPYEGRILMVIRDYDSATIEAMNASLKLLEEPPEYVIILLIVSESEAVLETVRSRVLDYTRKKKDFFLDEDTQKALKEFQNGNIGELVSVLSKRKVEKDEAVSILVNLRKSADKNTLERIEKAISELMYINESPRNILDRVILFWRKY